MADNSRSLRMRSSVVCATTALLTARALGRAGLPMTGDEMPSAYAAGAVRSKATLALPQSVLVSLLPTPVIVRNASPDNRQRNSRCSTVGLVVRCRLLVRFFMVQLLFHNGSNRLHSGTACARAAWPPARTTRCAHHGRGR